jgi:hypothetical protein
MRQLPGFQNIGGLGGQMQQQLGLGGMTQGLGSFGERTMKLLSLIEFIDLFCFSAQFQAFG